MNCMSADNKNFTSITDTKTVKYKKLKILPASKE